MSQGWVKNFFLPMTPYDTQNTLGYSRFLCPEYGENGPVASICSPGWLFVLFNTHTLKKGPMVGRFKKKTFFLRMTLYDPQNTLGDSRFLGPEYVKFGPTALIFSPGWLLVLMNTHTLKKGPYVTGVGQKFFFTYDPIRHPKHSWLQ